MIEEIKINIKFTPLTLMWADFLTKALSSHEHLQCCKNIELPNHTNTEEKARNFDYFPLGGSVGKYKENNIMK